MQLPPILQGDSLTRLVQGAAAGAIAIVVVGFTWGGWTTASGTQKLVENAQQASVVRVLAPICADKFQHSAEAGTNLKALNAADSWKRNDMIEKAGWTTFPGSSPERGVADACMTLLNEVKK